MKVVIMKIVVKSQQPRWEPRVKPNNQFMILGIVPKTNNTTMFKRGQKDNKIIKGTLENKKNQSNNRKKLKQK